MNIKDFQPCLVIFWLTQTKEQEYEYIPLSIAVSKPSVDTLAKYETDGRIYTYRYPATAEFKENILRLTYSDSPPEWPTDWGWNMEAGYTEITFETQNVWEPRTVTWYSNSKGPGRELKQGKDWDFFADPPSGISSLVDAISFYDNEVMQDPSEPFSTVEGQLKLKKHLAKERSSTLIKAFKKNLSDFSCAVCGFSFEAKYGAHGTRFIEAHHTVPIGSLEDERQTSIEDLVGVCSNCHRMLHKTTPPLTVEKLKGIINE